MMDFQHCQPDPGCEYSGALPAGRGGQFALIEYGIARLSPFIHVLMEAVKLVEGLVAVEDPAGFGCIVWLVGSPHVVCWGKRLAIEVRLIRLL